MTITSHPQWAGGSCRKAHKTDGSEAWENEQRLDFPPLGLREPWARSPLEYDVVSLHSSRLTYL